MNLKALYFYNQYSILKTNDKKIYPIILFLYICTLFVDANQGL